MKENKLRVLLAVFSLDLVSLKPGEQGNVCIETLFHFYINDSKMLFLIEYFVSIPELTALLIWNLNKLINSGCGKSTSSFFSQLSWLSFFYSSDIPSSFGMYRFPFCSPDGWNKVWNLTRQMACFTHQRDITDLSIKGRSCRLLSPLLVYCLVFSHWAHVNLLK